MKHFHFTVTGNNQDIPSVLNRRIKLMQQISQDPTEMCMYSMQGGNAVLSAEKASTDLAVLCTKLPICSLLSLFLLCWSKELPSFFFTITRQEKWLSSERPLVKVTKVSSTSPGVCSDAGAIGWLPCSYPAFPLLYNSALVMETKYERTWWGKKEFLWRHSRKHPEALLVWAARKSSILKHLISFWKMQNKKFQHAHTHTHTPLRKIQKEKEFVFSYSTSKCILRCLGLEKVIS